MSRKLLFIPIAVAMIVSGLLMPGADSRAASAYRSMQEELDRYTPPVFPAAVDGETAPAGAESPGGDSSGSVPAAMLEKGLDAIRADLDREIETNRLAGGFFGPDYGAVIKNLAETTNDDNAVRAAVAKGVSLKELVGLAVLRDPEIRAARREVAGARAAFDQVAGLDEVLWAYQGITRAISPGAGPGAARGDIRQMWPRPGRTALKGRIAAADVAMARIRLDIAENRTATLTAQGFWDLILVDESLTITRETLDALDRLKGVATSLYNSGRTGFQDIARINIRVALLKESLTTLTQRRKTVSIALAERLNLPQSAGFGRGTLPPGPPAVPDPDSLYPKALAHRQELLLLRQKIQKLSHMVELGESMADAPLTLGFSYFDNNIAGSSGSEGEKGAFAGRTMAAMKNGQPVRAFNGTAQPFLEETRQTLAGLEQTLAAREKAAVSMVREAWAALDQSRREAALYENEILPLTRSALDVATREYETGGIGFGDAIAAYTDWLNARLDLARKRAGSGKALARLEQMIGTTFPF